MYDPRDLWVFTLAFARVTALITVAPGFNHKAIPKQTKIGFAAILSFALAPLLVQSVKTTPPDLFTLVGQLAAEVAVGIALGFTAQLLFSSIQMAGQYIDTQMGFGIINVLNPLSEQHNSAMGQLLYQLAMTVFLILGGHLFLIGTVAESYSIVSAGGAAMQGDAAQAFINVAGTMFSLGLKIALPVAAVLLLLDVAFAVVARAIPQINIFLVGMPLKVVVGMMTLAILLPAVAAIVGDSLPLLRSGASELLGAMH